MINFSAYKWTKGINISIMIFVISSTLYDIKCQGQKKTEQKTQQEISNYNSVQFKLRLLQLKIANIDGEVIYPFTGQQKNKYFICGSLSSLKFQQQQVLFIQAKYPFVAVVSSKSEQIRMFGYAESQPSTQQGKHIAVLIVNRQCISYFTSQKYISIFKIYPRVKYFTSQPIINYKQNSNTSFANSLNLENSNQLTLQIPSITYCLQEVQLKSLEGAFNLGYYVMLLIVASMLPSFPIVGKIHRLNILFLIALTQVNLIDRAPVINVICILVLTNPINRRYRSLQVQSQIAFKLFRNSLVSLFLVYFINYVSTLLTSPSNLEQIKQASWIYTTQLYVKSSIQSLIILQVSSSVLWINRVRSFFWWFVLIIVYEVIRKKYEYNDVQLFGVLLPSLFTQSCQFRSILLPMLMLPLCHFMDRFNKVKFGALLVLVTIALFGAYSQLLAIGVSMIWILGWIITTVSQDGFFVLFNRRWLTISDLSAIQN